MNYYRITARLEAPLVIQTSRQSNTSQTMPYLPGGTLRGALAAKYIYSGGCPDDSDFQHLFLKDPVSFPNLLPSDKSGKIIPQVLPLTSVSCKREPGFSTGRSNDSNSNRDNDNTLHGVADFLALKAMAKKDRGIDTNISCPVCGKDMKSFAGFWNGKIEKPEKFTPTINYKRHTGIDRNTGIISPSIFFITQSMANFKSILQENTREREYYPQYLTGIIASNEAQLKIIRELISDTVFAGADRTRGYGEIHLLISNKPVEVPNVDIIDWDRQFKKKLNTDSSNYIYFSIKLESDAILVDRFLRPASDLNLLFKKIEPVLKIARSKTIRGWNTAWGLSKPDDIGLLMGSIFLYKYTGDDRANLIRFLNELTISGIGVRKEEGFGRISICDPLHTIMEVI